MGMEGGSGIYDKIENNQVKIYSLSQPAQKGRTFLLKDKTVYTKRRDPQKRKETLNEELKSQGKAKKR